MGLRYKKSIKVAPGVKINLNKKSSSITIGGKGYHKTFNSNGQTTTSVNLPVKGLSYTDRKNGASKRKSTTYTSSASSTPAASSSTVRTTSTSKEKNVAKKEKKPATTVLLLDKPTIAFVIIGIIIFVFAFFLFRSSIPAGIIVALFGMYFFYEYISFKRNPSNPKYITEDQLERWRHLTSSNKETVGELQKVSLPILLELKRRTESYYAQLSTATAAADIEKCSELLLKTQQKIIDFSEFVTIKGDEPQKDFEKYSSLVKELNI